MQLWHFIVVAQQRFNLFNAVDLSDHSRAATAWLTTKRPSLINL